MSSWIGSVGVTPIVVCVVVRLSRITAVGASFHKTCAHLRLHFQTWTQSVCFCVACFCVACHLCEFHGSALLCCDCSLSTVCVFSDRGVDFVC